MDEPVFDAEGLFDDDYLYFHELRDTEGTLSARETELIWNLLEVEPGFAVLDLACGHGRIANRLAERGAIVTGLDATPLFLDNARADAATRHVAVTYVHGDMRDLPWDGAFDRVINWFTAFGYFSDADNKAVLDQVYRSLKPNGRFAMELNNLPTIMRAYQSTTAAERDGDLLVDRHRFDPITGRNHVDRTIIRDGAVRHVSFEVRMFTFPELRDWLRAAGFSSVAGSGEDGEPLTAQHRRMIVTASKTDLPG